MRTVSRRNGSAALSLALLLAVSACAAQTDTDASVGAGRGSSATAATTAHGLMSWRWVMAPDHTDSKQWVTVDPEESVDPAMPLRVPADGLVTALLSVTIHGAKVQLRATDNGKTMQPGLAQFPAGHSKDSHTFSYSRMDHPMTCGHTIRLQWRSPSGREVALTQGQLVVTYRPHPEPSPCP